MGDGTGHVCTVAVVVVGVGIDVGEVVTRHEPGLRQVWSASETAARFVGDPPVPHRDYDGRVAGGDVPDRLCAPALRRAVAERPLEA